LVRETYQDPAVIQTLNERFVPVRLEGRSHMDLVKEFEVRGAPTTLLFSADGKEQARIVGFEGAEGYLKELAKVS
jgi:hypothetical protein